MDKINISVLVVEDDKGDLKLINEYCRKSKTASYKIQNAETLGDAEAFLEANNTDIILLDLNLPDSQGQETFLRLREHASKIPIIILTGMDDEATALNLVHQGAQDYLLKDEIRGRWLDKSIRFALERHNLLKLITDMNMHDELTGLFNRRGFMLLLDHHIKRVERHAYNVQLFYIDLNNFKSINDKYGHTEGDKALKYSTEILRKTFRETDITARLGGDEFAVFSTESNDSNKELIMQRLEKNTYAFNKSGKTPYEISMSIGCSEYDADKIKTIEDLINEADKNMYSMKKEREPL